MDISKVENPEEARYQNRIQYNLNTDEEFTNEIQN